MLVCVCSLFMPPAIISISDPFEAQQKFIEDFPALKILTHQYPYLSGYHPDLPNVCIKTLIDFGLIVSILFPFATVMAMFVFIRRMKSLKMTQSKKTYDMHFMLLKALLAQYTCCFFLIVIPLFIFCICAKLEVTWGSYFSTTAVMVITFHGMHVKEYLGLVETVKRHPSYKQVRESYLLTDTEKPKEEYEKEPETPSTSLRPISLTMPSNQTEMNYSTFHLIRMTPSVTWHGNEECFKNHDEDSKNADPFKTINEYTLYYDFKIKTRKQGPPWTSTIILNEESYCGDAATTKKEARKNTAMVIYETLKESNKWYEYKQEQAVRRAEMRSKTEKYRMIQAKKINYAKTALGEDSGEKKAPQKLSIKKEYPGATVDRKDAEILAQQKALQKIIDEIKVPNSFQLIKEYAEFYNTDFEVTDYEKVASFRTAIQSDVIYYTLVESDKYSGHVQEKKAPKAQKKLEKSKRRADKKKAGGSSGKTEFDDEVAVVESDKKDAL
uniref:G_PROTEIN_RECEP_F1_2 domain-containing protein n=2 Tax=Panagrellus redivivus TaxID=6233 RepID=A0A7E4V5I1_PANRE